MLRKKNLETSNSLSAKGGFTLIEILAALAILSIAIVVILGSFQLGLKSIQDAADRSECLAVAQAILTAEGVISPLGSKPNNFVDFLMAR
jgi:prepilin-type N-terminal cleavage/methylation domain-containing protein